MKIRSPVEDAPVKVHVRTHTTPVNTELREILSGGARLLCAPNVIVFIMLQAMITERQYVEIVCSNV